MCLFVFIVRCIEAIICPRGGVFSRALRVSECYCENPLEHELRWRKLRKQAVSGVPIKLPFSSGDNFGDLELAPSCSSAQDICLMHLKVFEHVCIIFVATSCSRLRYRIEGRLYFVAYDLETWSKNIDESISISMNNIIMQWATKTN